MSKNAISIEHLPASATREPPASTAPGPAAPPGKWERRGTPKEVPCPVSKRQHSKRGECEVRTRRPRRTWAAGGVEGRRLARVRRVARSRLPYGPRRRAAPSARRAAHRPGWAATGAPPPRASPSPGKQHFSAGRFANPALNPYGLALEFGPSFPFPTRAEEGEEKQLV